MASKVELIVSIVSCIVPTRASRLVSWVTICGVLSTEDGSPSCGAPDASLVRGCRVSRQVLVLENSASRHMTREFHWLKCSPSRPCEASSSPVHVHATGLSGSPPVLGAVAEMMDPSMSFSVFAAVLESASETVSMPDGWTMPRRPE